MVRRYLRNNPPYLILVLLLVLSIFTYSSCSNATGENQVHPELTDFFNISWAENKLWDDGQAEILTYEAERVIYGKVRHFEQVFILVKETFNKEHQVKTDDYKRSDLFEVMKVNQFARIKTDNYPYHFLASFFYNRGNATALHKATLSSQEWCGNTFKSFKRTEELFNYDYNSYWDGQGEGTLKLKNNILFEDQLSYSLRALNFQDSLIFHYPVLETQVSNKADTPVIYEALFKVEDAKDGKEALWQISVNLDSSKTNFYWFRKEYPNVLVRQKTWDGRNMKLKSHVRNQYWVSE